LVRSVIKKNVEIARHIAQRPKKERDLPPMVNAMNGAVMHQVTETHGMLWSAAE